MDSVISGVLVSVIGEVVSAVVVVLVGLDDEVSCEENCVT